MKAPSGSNPIADKPAQNTAGTVEILFAMNRDSNRAEVMSGFSCFEHLQGALRCGIRLSDDTSANGIGRCKSMHDFLTRAAKSQTLVIGDVEGCFEIQLPHKTWSKVGWDVFRSWTGKRKVDGKIFEGPSYYWLSTEVSK